MAHPEPQFLSTCIDEVLVEDLTTPVVVLHLCDHYTLVPSSLFETVLRNQFLEVNDPVHDTEVFSEPVEGVKAELVFAVPEPIVREVAGQLGDCTWTAHISALCSSLVSLSARQRRMRLGVFVRNHMVDVLLADAGSLLFCNSFPISGASDILFFAIQAVRAHNGSDVTPVSYMAESPQLSLQARQILGTHFPKVSVWKSEDDISLFNLLPLCE